MADHHRTPRLPDAAGFPHGLPADIGILARGLWRPDDQHLLLCQNTKRGYWYLPGGHVEPGESVAHAIRRELYEEAGLLGVDVGPCLFVEEHLFNQRGAPRHEYTFVHHIAVEHWPRDEHGRPAPVAAQEPKLDFGWFEPAALTDLDLRPGGLKAWLTAHPGNLDTPHFLSTHDLHRPSS